MFLIVQYYCCFRLETIYHTIEEYLEPYSMKMRICIPLTKINRSFFLQINSFLKMAKNIESKPCQANDNGITCEKDAR
jgi:hypothetical protein